MQSELNISISGYLILPFLVPKIVSQVNEGKERITGTRKEAGNGLKRAVCRAPGYKEAY